MSVMVFNRRAYCKKFQSCCWILKWVNKTYWQTDLEASGKETLNKMTQKWITVTSLLIKIYTVTVFTWTTVSLFWSYFYEPHIQTPGYHSFSKPGFALMRSLIETSVIYIPLILVSDSFLLQYSHKWNNINLTGTCINKAVFPPSSLVQFGLGQ